MKRFALRLKMMILSVLAVPVVAQVGCNFGDVNGALSAGVTTAIDTLFETIAGNIGNALVGI